MKAQVLLLGDTLAARDKVFQRMDDSTKLRDEYVDRELDKHKEWLARHHHDLKVSRVIQLVGREGRRIGGGECPLEDLGGEHVISFCRCFQGTSYSHWSR